MATLGPLLVLAGAGGVVGAFLLLFFPAETFEALVPFLVLFATTLSLPARQSKKSFVARFQQQPLKVVDRCRGLRFWPAFMVATSERARGFSCLRI